MTSSFLIVMSIWFGINILFVAARLWVTRPAGWQIDTCSRQLSPVRVKSRMHHHF